MMITNLMTISMVLVAFLASGCQELGQERFEGRTSNPITNRSGGSSISNPEPTPRIKATPEPRHSESPTPSPSPTATLSPDPTPSSSPSVEVAYVYPELRYFGTGNMIHTRRNDPYPVTRNVMLKPSQARMDVDLLAFNSSNGNVDDRIKDKIGLTRFTRTDAAKVKALRDLPGERSGPIPFAIYAESIEVGLKDGTKNRFSFSRPMPVFINPGNQNRYRDIATNPITVESKVRAQLENEDGDIEEMEFSLRIKFSMKTPTSGQQLNIVMDANIVEDDSLANGDEAGKYYGVFPLDKRSEFGIDPVQERIIRLTTSTDFNDDGRRQRIEFDYRICSEKIDEKLSNFECGQPMAR